MSGPNRIAAATAAALGAVVALAGDAPAVGDWPADRVAARPLPLGSVKVGGFLGSHIDASNRTSLTAALASPIAHAFEARGRGEEPPATTKRLATDSDFYKWLEGACYAIEYDPSLHELSNRIDAYARLVASLQEPSGFLGTRLSPAEPFDQKVWHDLYVAGHLFEAAVAHHRATGSRALLDAACRLADFYLRAFREKHPYFAEAGRREHPEVEIALVRLFRATGEQRFLEFADALARLSTIAPTIAETRAGASGTHAVRFFYLLLSFR